MAAEAEGTRIAKAKVIESEGEIKAAENLKEASQMMMENPQIMLLRYLQTLNSIASNNSATIFFPFPMELPTTNTGLNDQIMKNLSATESGEDAPFPQYHSHDKATHSCREIRFFITLPQNTKSHLIGKVYAGSYFWVVCNMQQAWLLSRLRRCGAPAVPRELIVADGFTPITAASACWPASPASLSHGDVRYNHLLLSSRAGPPLRTFANLKNTLGVGQKRDHVNKDISLPLQLQKTMATEAESSRLANAKIIVAKAEIESTKNLQKATKLLMDNPYCMQLRYLQALQMIAGENTHTVVLPITPEMFKGLFK
ncbi:unnamed protein product [Spodoptera exigua]|nr:unnamed protein product [Spodoptera exigua]